MFFKEIGYALRQLHKSAGFTTLSILTLALGIGGSTAVFTVVDSVLLKPLSYPNSRQLVALWEQVPFFGSGYAGPNPRHASIWRDRAVSLSQLALLRQGAWGVSLSPSDHPQLVGTVKSSPNLLDTLQVKPLLGRSFKAGDAVEGHENVAILTYNLWQSLFGGDPNVIGRTVRVDNIPHEVVGVLARDFRFPDRSILNAFPSAPKRGGEIQEAQIFLPIPINLNEIEWNGDYGNWLVLGRLKTGFTVQQSQAELNTIQEQIIRQIPPGEMSNKARGLLKAYVQPMQEAMVGESQKGLWLLFAAVGSLMLIACVNLANAQLGRAITREREATIRSALGASRWQLLWNSLTETLLLAIAGGLAGVWLADLAVNAFRHYAPIDLPRIAEIQLNWSVLLFAAFLMISSGFLFGLLPALKLLRTDPQAALQRNSSRLQNTKWSRPMRFGLVGLQVFACTALLLTTGLLTKSLLHLLGSDRGYETQHVVVAEVTPSLTAQSIDQQRTAAIGFDDAVLSKLRSLPGMQSVGLVSAMPLEGERWIEPLIRPDRPNDNRPLCNVRWVSSGYFETIRERLVAGRLFQESDHNQKAAIISQTAARVAWPGENPLGKPIQWRNVTYTVVGIVGDARNNSLKTPPISMFYLPYTVLPQYPAFFLVRSAQPPDAITASMRRAIWGYDPTVTIARIKSFDSQVADSLATERFQTLILVAFGTAALFLAMLGIYGILSYTVAARKQEIGVRMALGATSRQIYALTMSEAAIPVLAGLVGGWATSLAIGRMIRSLLYGVKEADMSVALTVVALFLIATTLAAFLPARRAATIDPMKALRTE